MVVLTILPNEKANGPSPAKRLRFAVMPTFSQPVQVGSVYGLEAQHRRVLRATRPLMVQYISRFLSKCLHRSERYSHAIPWFLVSLLFCCCGMIQAADERAITPVPRDQEWQDKHAQHVLLAQKQQPQILLVGDSLLWPFARDRYANRLLPGMNHLTVAHPGDRIEHVLWRVEHGMVRGLQPQLIVVLLGTNNLRQHKYVMAPETIAAGLEHLIARIRQDCPGTPILLYGLLPRKYKPSKNLMPGSIPQTNTFLKAVSERDPLVHYEDLSSLFQVHDGEIKEHLYRQDGLHPNDHGETLLIEQFNRNIPSVLKMLKAEKGDA